jgi:DeoR/GlpR family transcriptional regulator of sugar metabolism
MRHTPGRRDSILKQLSQNTHASVADLARELGCSEMTIRRDLDRLAADGLIQRSHGGASVSRMVRLEFTLAAKADQHAAEKAAIARAAAQLIQPGERVIIDIGTTTLAVARELRSHQGISVVTPSLAVVSALLSVPGVECILLGGTVRESAPDLYGPLLEDNLSRMHTDWALVGCDGLSIVGGLTAADPRTARSTALMLTSAAKVALLVDSSKAESDAFIGFAKLEDLDYLITDQRMPAEILAAARAAAVQTVVVTPEA